MKSLGYTVGRCIYCGRQVGDKRPDRRPSGIVCVRHWRLLRLDPLVPRPETVKGSEK